MLMIHKKYLLSLNVLSQNLIYFKNQCHTANSIHLIKTIFSRLCSQMYPWLI